MLISDSNEDFGELCDKYKGRNIHWLKKENNELVWQQSRGVLSKLHEFVNASSKQHTPEKITDIPGKVVIISAEPGMGKSTVLTHLAMETTKIKPNLSALWVARVNLLDHSGEFTELEEKKIDKLEAVKFLYVSVQGSGKEKK